MRGINSNPHIHFQWLETVPYAEASGYQLQVAQLVAVQQKTVVIGLEHPRVVTLGRRMQKADVSIPRDIPLIRTQRGGQATLHNLGQLVIYPIVPLSYWQLGVREYVELLIQATEKFLLKCNITVIVKNNGLHTENGKIASFGINVKKGIATHGLAINIKNDLSDFSHIHPCGIQGQTMDKVENYIDLSLPKAFELWCSEFEPLLSARASSNLTSVAIRT